MKVRDFDSAFWNDDDVRKLSWLATLLYIWTFTNRRCTPTGIYKVDRLEIAAATGIEAGKIEGLFTELKAAGLARYAYGQVQLERAHLDRAA